MKPVQPRFICTPYRADQPRGKWTVYDHATGKRYEVYGEQEAKGVVAEVQRVEVEEFLALEAGAMRFRNAAK